MRTAVLLALLCWPGALCAQIMAPMAVQYRPPAYYAELWQAVGECVGKPAPVPFEAVRFYAAPHIVMPSSPSALVAGAANGETHQIIVIFGAVHHSRIVAHEMLHLYLPGLEETDPEFRRCDPMAG